MISSTALMPKERALIPRDYFSRPQTGLAPDSLTLLLLEDEPSDIALAYDLLEKGMSDYAWEVTSVTHMDEAIATLSAKRFDLVLTDLGLKDIEGAQTIDLLSMVVPHLPIVVYTGSGDPKLLTETLKRGALFYLQKDALSPEILRATLLAALVKAPLFPYRPYHIK